MADHEPAENHRDPDTLFSTEVKPAKAMRAVTKAKKTIDRRIMY